MMTWITPQTAPILSATLAFTRPFVKKVLRIQKESTNADRVIGQAGVVLEAVDNDLGTGRVKVMGLDWSAQTRDGGRIGEGEKIQVLSIEGVKLIVEPYSKETKTE